jgi:hypothetical protein
MEGANLGNIFASITLYTKQLTGISSARNTLSEMARSLASAANQCATLQASMSVGWNG